MAVANVMTMSCAFKIWLRKYYFGVGAYWDLDNKERSISLKFIRNINTMWLVLFARSVEGDLADPYPQKVVKHFLKCVIMEFDD
ncbi:MAG: hypothetical protein CMQ31_00475 [Gammaproteobacteria bacterium]|nr:hypothetical protein [Gammaproteobacteria bacterium]